MKSLPPDRIFVHCGLMAEETVETKVGVAASTVLTIVEVVTSVRVTGFEDVAGIVMVVDTVNVA